MIKIQNVRKTIKKVHILKGVDIHVKKGDLFGFLGPNGAGKTTTISIMTGIMLPDEGQVTIAGSIPRSKNAIRNIGYLPENFSPPPGLKIVEFLEFTRELTMSLKRKSLSTFELLRLVELEHVYNRLISALSKGMLQRLGIAQALMGNPEILILDEPLSGLDPLGRKIIKRVMLNLVEMGKTVFFSSHILQDVDELCLSLAIIHKGSIIFSGNLEEFKFLYGGNNLEEAFFNSIKEDNPL